MGRDRRGRGNRFPQCSCCQGSRSRRSACGRHGPDPDLGLAPGGRRRMGSWSPPSSWPDASPTRSRGRSRSRERMQLLPDGTRRIEWSAPQREDDRLRIPLAVEPVADGLVRSPTAATWPYSATRSPQHWAATTTSAGRGALSPRSRRSGARPSSGHASTALEGETLRSSSAGHRLHGRPHRYPGSSGRRRGRAGPRRESSPAPSRRRALLVLHPARDGLWISAGRPPSGLAGGGREHARRRPPQPRARTRARAATRRGDPRRRRLGPSTRPDRLCRLPHRAGLHARGRAAPVAIKRRPANSSPASSWRRASTSPRSTPWSSPPAWRRFPSSRRPEAQERSRATMRAASTPTARAPRKGVPPSPP